MVLSSRAARGLTCTVRPVLAKDSLPSCRANSVDFSSVTCDMMGALELPEKAVGARVVVQAG